ncbi:MAG: Glu-tRNA(Gln) amidotransferase subunit GatD [archaeon]|jgi:glutamyl-tRNA(Gln) amidotransferase subunit D
MEILTSDRGKLIKVLKTKGKDKIQYLGHIVNISGNELTVKLEDNGYNISITLDKDVTYEILAERKELGKTHKLEIKQNPKLPSVCLVATGGTIGTHVDYKTGGVNMSRTPEEILSTVPELLEVVNIKKIVPAIQKASEDICYKDWQVIAKAVYEQLIDPEIDGIIISHGTDTLAWTGTVLSFMIQNINKPILMVGAQRSPDRASFDGAMNLVCAAHFIKEKMPGVYTVMHGSISDDFCHIIKAVKSRKMHSSRRDSFKAVNDTPVARVFSNGQIEYLKDKKLFVIPKEKPKLDVSYSDTVTILKAYPNSNPEVIDWYINKGYKGIIIEGTGLGHCPTDDETKKLSDPTKDWLPYIEKATKKGIIVIMTTQCLFGRVNGNVYSNLRNITKAGAEYLDQHDMLPEVAYIKLSIALGRFKTREEIMKFMEKNLAGEISKKEVPADFDGFE